MAIAGRARNDEGEEGLRVEPAMTKGWRKTYSYCTDRRISKIMDNRR